MAKHVLQYHVFSSSPLTSAAATLQVFDATDDSPATLYDDRDGTTTLGHEQAVSGGFFRFYVDAGRYNLRVFNEQTGDERWFYDVDAGQWSA